MDTTNRVSVPRLARPFWPLLLALAVPAGAQSLPLGQPLTSPSQLATGGGMYFNVTVNKTVTWTRIQYVAADTSLAGASSVNVYIRLGTWVGSVTTGTGPWYHIASTAPVSIPGGADTPVTGVLQPVAPNTATLTLPPGQYGIALESVGHAWGYQSMAATLTASNGEFSVTTGGGSNSFLAPGTLTPCTLNGSVDFMSGGPNLIENPGFEVGAIPTDSDQVGLATGWQRGCAKFWQSTAPGGITGSPDLFDRRTTNCKYAIPVNKWTTGTDELTGANRYVGFSGGNYHSVGGVSTAFYGESVQGRLNGPLVAAPCGYTISIWATAIEGYPQTCGSVLPKTPCQYNQIEAVLRKDGDCGSGLVVWTSPNVTSLDWMNLGGMFALTPAQAAVGYNQIEFRLTPVPAGHSLFGESHIVYLDNVSLTSIAAQGYSPDFTLSATLPSGSLGTYSLTATMPSLPPGGLFWWKVCEIDYLTNLPIAGTCMENPPNWWHSSLHLTNPFPGYCCNPGTTSGSGVFYAGHKYEITRGTWGPCNAWTQATKRIYMASSGANFMTYGLGCDGLELRSNAPVIGGSWDLAITGVASGSPIAITVVGTSSVSMGLPLSVLGIESPGCSYYIGGQVLGTLTAPNLGGIATSTVAVPFNPALQGASLTAQSVGLTLAMPSLVGTSNGLTATLGQ